MHYFIPATISSACRRVEKASRTPSCHCRSSQLLYSYCTTQSLLSKIVFEIIIGVGLRTSTVLHSYQFDCGHTVDIDNDQYRHVDSGTIPG
jgi:hypothetical protein